MQIDWWTLALQAVNALVLVWLLARFLFRPVAKIVAQRQQAAATLLNDASAAREQAATTQAQAAAELARIAAERGAMLDAASAEAAKAKNTLEAIAQAEIDRQRAAAQRDIESGRRAAALADIQRASELALDIAAKLADRLPAEARVAGFIEGLAAAVAGLSDSARKQMKDEAASLRLIAARTLTPQELQRCTTALEGALECPVPAPAVVVDPTLIAGLELEAEHVQVRNSWRHDLAQIRVELCKP